MLISPRFNGFIGVIATGVLALAGMLAPVEAKHDGVVFAVTMTNDQTVNEIKVYDAGANTLVETLSTEGRGGVAGNARGIKQYQGKIVAAVNNGSNSVAI